MAGAHTTLAELAIATEERRGGMGCHCGRSCPWGRWPPWRKWLDRHRGELLRGRQAEGIWTFSSFRDLHHSVLLLAPPREGYHTPTRFPHTHTHTHPNKKMASPIRFQIGYTVIFTPSASSRICLLSSFFLFGCRCVPSPLRPTPAGISSDPPAYTLY